MSKALAGVEDEAMAMRERDERWERTKRNCETAWGGGGNVGTLLHDARGFHAKKNLLDIDNIEA